MTDGRSIAYAALTEFEKKGTFPRKSLLALTSRAVLTRQERHLAEELTYGVLQRSVTLDYALSALTGKRMTQLDLSVRVLLRMGAYQLLYLDRVPAHAAINETVRLAARHCARAKGFVNGVLRTLSRTGCELPQEEDAASLSVRFSLQQPLVQLLLDQYGSAVARRMLEGFEQRPQLHLFVNTQRGDPESLCSLTGGQRTPIEQVICVPASDITEISGFEEGHFHVMGYSAALAVLAADPRQGETIVDLCAAPGGKCFAAAVLQGDSGRVHAFDLTQRKVNLIKEGAARLGLASIAAQPADALHPKPDLEGAADLVLCDLPCSGLGILAKQPEIRLKRPEGFSELPELQLSMLRNAVPLIRRGGRLLYSTCTLNKQENEGVVQALLREHPECKAIDLSGLAETHNAEYLADSCGITLLPGAQQDGFYISLIARGGQ